MQINRLFEIIYILLDKKNVTARELTQHFGVSRRTICRDIDTLSAAGIPIYTERGKGGGIRLMPEFVLNKSILSEREQNEILSALQALSYVKADETNQVLQKLSAVFNKTATDWLDVVLSGWGHEHDCWNGLKNAILERRVVSFDYFNSHGDKTFREVEPYQLCFKTKAWYLKGFCLTKQAMRTYRLTRIRNFDTSDKPFTPRDTAKLLADTGHKSPAWPNSVTVKLRIEPEMTYRVYDDFHESIVEKQPDGSFIATVDWPEDNWLYGFILSFGKNIEVLEPVGLRGKIKDMAQDIAKKYL